MLPLLLGFVRHLRLLECRLGRLRPSPESPHLSIKVEAIPKRFIEAGTWYILKGLERRRPEEFTRRERYGGADTNTVKVAKESAEIAIGEPPRS
jgi:hypothetical protein